MRRHTKAWLAALSIAAVIAAGCGDDGGSEATPGVTGSAGGSSAVAATTTVPPRVGGTVTFGSASQVAGLDPVVATGNSSNGGIEMLAVYDTLLRFDPATGVYSPRLAVDVTGSADNKVWTIKLRPGVTFSDGTPFNADAVAFGINRHRSGIANAPACADLFACPRNSTLTALYATFMQEVRAVDPLTVQVTLAQGWSGFRFALATETGMIPSPTALKKCDATKAVNLCAFNLAPVGAGPFMVTSFKAQESITMVRNPNYWDGQVYLDGLTFVSLGDGGGANTLQGVKTGSLQAAYVADAQAVAQVLDEKLPNFYIVSDTGTMLLFNNGVSVTCAAGKPEPLCVGKPDGPTVTSPVTKDVRIRKAIALAIDPVALDQRANAGKGRPTADIISQTHRWYPGVKGPSVDLAASRALVAAAKADGWDGKVRLLFDRTPATQANGIAIEAMLRNVGMDPQLDTSKDLAGHVAQVITQKDFDVTQWGINLTPDDGVVKDLLQNFTSTSPSNRIGYKSPVIDQAVSDFLAATTDDAKKAAMKKFLDQVYLDTPVLSLGQRVAMITWSPKLHDVASGALSEPSFAKAWLEG